MRFQVRTLLLIIAMLAVTLGVAQAVERKGLYRRCAGFHGAKASLASTLADNPKVLVFMCGTGYQGVPQLASDPCRVYYASSAPPNRGDYLADAAFHTRMKREYESRGWW